MKSRGLGILTALVWGWLLVSSLSASKSLVLISGTNTLEPLGVVSISGQCIAEGTVTLTFPYVAPAFTFKSANGRQVVDIPQVTAGQPVTVEKTSGSAKVTCVWSAVMAATPTPTPTPTVTPTPTPTVTPTPTPTPPVSFSQLTPVGKFLMPASGADTAWAMPAIAARVVSGQVRVFVLGHVATEPLYELAVPTTLSAFTTPFASTVRATLVKNHGKVWGSVRKTWTGACVPQDPINNVATGAMYWHEAQQALLFTYVDAYNAAGNPNWGLASTTLDQSPNVVSGPWRVKVPVGSIFRWGPERALFLQTDPRDQTMLTGSTIVSNNAPFPWGPNLSRLASWPTPLTPAGCGQPDLLAHAVYVDHPQSGFAAGAPPGVSPWPNWTTFRRAELKPFFETVEGGVTADPAKTGGLSSWQQRDRVSGFVALADAVCFFVELTDDHTWYNNAAGTNDDHGKVDPLGVTGPTFTSRRLGVYTYARADLDQVAAGTVKPHLVRPVEFTDLTAQGVEMTPAIPDPGNVTVTVLSSQRLVFLISTRLETTTGGGRRSVVYVWRY